MNELDIAKLLGIKVSHTTQSDRGEYWTLETPASVKPRPFTKEGIATYEFKTKDEMESFVAGYSLVIRYLLQIQHTPQ